MSEQIEVHLMGLILDPVSKMPVMLLKPENLDKIIPIWIGISEANSITIELEKIKSPRPMTHDLINSLIEEFHFKVDKVIINEILDNTYYAELHIGNGVDSKILDCRPSDAVAIALKSEAKIFISDQVYQNFDVSGISNDFFDSEDKVENWFNSLSKEDFGEVEH
ncbi:MAG: bifunctional nuclease family protein [Acidobacteriota bacterium]